MASFSDKSFDKFDWVLDYASQRDLNEETVIAIYNKTCHNYDEVLSGAGYSAPKILSKAFEKAAIELHGSHEARKIRILDIGAGTGLVGAELKSYGFYNLDAIDCTRDMLQKAKEKNLYQKMIVSFIDEKKIDQIQDGEYDALISVGAFAGPSIQARAFDEMIRWLKQGGLFCFTTRVADLQDTSDLGYREKFSQLEEERAWKLLSRDVADYIQNPGGMESLVQKAYINVYQKL